MKTKKDPELTYHAKENRYPHKTAIFQELTWASALAALRCPGDLSSTSSVEPQPDVDCESSWSLPTDFPSASGTPERNNASSSLSPSSRRTQGRGALLPG
ncbi:hypothetical protein Ahy_A08g038928 isoform E [Arachis hypogaea]|uniref:Uncharacterized protein n=1 Tax=Arachis hypogaea TaxID=3818 RepID=A0A445BUW9_ARAHY|nr:hypothetical protein Ahy_A08g038928 isoform E [Arachis hypogaea]